MPTPVLSGSSRLAGSVPWTTGQHPDSHRGADHAWPPEIARGCSRNAGEPDGPPAAVPDHSGQTRPAPASRIQLTDRAGILGKALPKAAYANHGAH
ncbi:hypothetical protein FRAAL6452 [Frankia alni ACN14a]|uniref:Uncharacterized protein n=1 Tax=Frankia alni (strain DSM 45986 / CECT 9034 / ACN14a) TaxID=326424 RepID=Q0RBV5_FRAAA|nr:hypothetical protein FRAAL6452 [Frankia alni ACN14a]